MILRPAFFVFCVLFALFFNQAEAQVVSPLPLIDTTTATVAKSYTRRVIRDSAFYARQKFVTDSIISHTWILPAALVDKNIIIDSILKAQIYGRSGLYTRYKDYKTSEKVSQYRTGTPVPKGNLWVLGVIALLMVLFASLKISFSKHLQTIVQSFFSNRILNNLNKEDNLFTSWPFLLLFAQFGFTIGMFFYLVTQYYHMSFADSGFRFYLSISISIVVLYVLKIVLLRLLGYLFNIQKAVNEYVSILYLSYFNIALMFIPLVIAFALSPLTYGPYYIAISFILLTIVFVFQFIRAGVNILSHYRFSKVYLFLYFCALEICPILILIKAIGL
ncbi:MAG: DUF4271 domain-containing protein [Candidatus Pedobacter colombiensis]|uniref:DUF4271 domain-containing protein n=1 Tax=Candidatus Pedobacter colombiensis TaxID=3121371 RepID=A0AAJ5W6M7_9SPHI|nr:DUF4271 domain-containing protein [Pedobacter sp.]WEK18969.1 MAG: DUF4271 domain-containing protein [Pedobacter sp.]